jgi:hypothetical protein
MNWELLIEAIRDEVVGLRICTEHPVPVTFDGRECPCCRIEWEFHREPQIQNPRVVARSASEVAARESRFRVVSGDGENNP